jgi:hypothetical protein
MSALDRLKSIQSNFKRQWNGLNCDLSGRSGTANFCNKKRTFVIPESVYEEEERQRQLLKVFTKLKELEEDKIASTPNPQSSASSFNKTVSSAVSGNGGFFSSSNTQASSQMYNA